jgi:hypothetical protein
MRDAALADAILGELASQFPQGHSFASLKDALPEFQELSTDTWLTAVDGLEKLGLVKGFLIRTGHTNSLRAIEFIEITPTGLSRSSASHKVNSLPESAEGLQTKTATDNESAADDPGLPFVSLFYSYSHADEDLRNQLERQLSPLKRQNLIREWHDRKLDAGEEIDPNIDRHLEEADVVLLLVSPDFIASDYCYSREVDKAMERHRAGLARVIPIILRPTDWHGMPFGKLLALPTDGKAVTTWPNRDEAFLDVVKGVRTAVSKLRRRSSAPGTTITLVINESFYSRDYNGIAIVGEIRNPTSVADQAANWSLEFHGLDLNISGGPGYSTFFPGQNWWRRTPFDIPGQRMTRGAVFFPGPLSWRTVPPRLPLRGSLTLDLFVGGAIKKDVEVGGIGAP